MSCPTDIGIFRSSITDPMVELTHSTYEQGNEQRMWSLKMSSAISQPIICNSTLIFLHPIEMCDEIFFLHSTFCPKIAESKENGNNSLYLVHFFQSCQISAEVATDPPMSCFGTWIICSSPTVVTSRVEIALSMSIHLCAPVGLMFRLGHSMLPVT